MPEAEAVSVPVAELDWLLESDRLVDWETLGDCEAERDVDTVSDSESDELSDDDAVNEALPEMECEEVVVCDADIVSVEVDEMEFVDDVVKVIVFDSVSDDVTESVVEILKELDDEMVCVDVSDMDLDGECVAEVDSEGKVGEALEDTETVNESLCVKLPVHEDDWVIELESDMEDDRDTDADKEPVLELVSDVVAEMETLWESECVEVLDNVMLLLTDKEDVFVNVGEVVRVELVDRDAVDDCENDTDSVGVSGAVAVVVALVVDVGGIDLEAESVDVNRRDGESENSSECVLEPASERVAESVVLMVPVRLLSNDFEAD